MISSADLDRLIEESACSLGSFYTADDYDDVHLLLKELKHRRSSTCKTCKWWKKSEYGYPHDAADHERRYCMRAKVNGQYSATHDRDEMEGDDPHGSPQISGPDFGCIHHEV